jgi:hypothetical protein
MARRNKDFVGKIWKIPSSPNFYVDDKTFKYIFVEDVSKPKATYNYSLGRVPEERESFYTRNCSYAFGLDEYNQKTSIELTPWRRSNAEVVTMEEFIVHGIN